MAAHPEYEPGVLPMPTAALVMAKETPGKAIVLVLHEDPHPATARAFADVAARGHVLFPDDGEEKGAGAVHDGNVGKAPVLIVGAQRLDDGEEKGMLGSSTHRIVGNAGGSRPTDPS